MDINFLLFEQFETLDLFGPVEICGRHPDFQLHYISQNGGLVTSAQGVRIDTKSQQDMNVSGVLVIPGGAGTRTLIKDTPFLKNLRRLSEEAAFVLSVCTGSALLARCGALEEKRATSNKRAFDWVVSTSDKVHWIRKARWVHDGKFYTSSVRHFCRNGHDARLYPRPFRRKCGRTYRLPYGIHMEQRP